MKCTFTFSDKYSFKLKQTLAAGSNLGLKSNLNRTWASENRNNLSPAAHKKRNNMPQQST